MKKLTLCLVATFLTLTFLPMQSIAQRTDSPTTLNTVKPIEQVEVKTQGSVSTEKIDQNKSNMKMLNNKKTRQVAVQVEGRHHHRGAYISGGGILLVILLIILLA